MSGAPEEHEVLPIKDHNPVSPEKDSTAGIEEAANKTPSYMRLSVHSLFTLAIYMIYGICLGILLTHPLSMGMSTFQVSFVLAAWPLGCIQAIVILPFLLKVPHVKFFMVLGIIQVSCLSSLYFTSKNMPLMLYSGSCLLCIVGA